MPIGFWILLCGQEKKSIVCHLVPTYDVNADSADVCQQRFEDGGGYPHHIVAFFVADTKGHVRLGGCSNFNVKNPGTVVCRLCSKSRATIVL